MKRLRWICLALAISVASGVLIQAQTIADAAREERERRKEVESKNTDAIPVVTNASASTTTNSSPAAKTKTVAPAVDKTKQTGPTDLHGHDEKYWRPKFDAARLAIKRAEDRLKVVDLRVADLNSRMSRISGTPTMRAELERATRDQTVAQKALADTNQKFAELEDELRRAGGLPGWSRPQ